MAKPQTRSVLPIRSFRTARAFRQWLLRAHAKSPGIRLRIYKKDAAVATVSYAEALDEALCFGWIDGQKLPHDDKSWIQKFVPRRSGSKWSKKNTEHVARLIKSGAMNAAGLKEVEAAKADGRWQAAYDSPSQASPPEEFFKALTKNGKASRFYATLNRANLYAIAYRLQTAKKPETKQKRIRTIIEMLARGETFH